MSDYHSTPTRPKARKSHLCVACGTRIPAGEQYVQQTGFFDGSAYRNRYHAECWDALSDEMVDFEFITGDVEPPARLSEAAMSREAKR